MIAAMRLAQKFGDLHLAKHIQDTIKTIYHVEAPMPVSQASAPPDECGKLSYYIVSSASGIVKDAARLLKQLSGISVRDPWLTQAGVCQLIREIRKKKKTTKTFSIRNADGRLLPVEVTSWWNDGRYHTIATLAESEAR